MFKVRSRIAAAAALLLTAVLTPAPAQAATRGFVDHLGSEDTGRWHRADGWSNGSVFDVGWRADHVGFRRGDLTLTLDDVPCPAGCSDKPYASGEYRTNDLYSSGKFETRMKAVKRSGTTTTFFTYTGPSDNQPWDEIDIEILGRNTRLMQTNYFTDGVGGHETVIDLGFDAAAGYHTYGFEWSPRAIKWYVDGRLVHREDGSRGPLPSHPQRIMMNLWPGIGVDDWLGPFTYPGRPLTAHYDWVRFTPGRG
ncbi:glycoside hydrolase family 16 protein [Actinoplanes sp. LDG1-06]|uniref:Beta-glucanase n=1 Tax=Paractinoplanes ovalisporus TaxID=2810368 RepID=A0ABS2AM66_9ACTN|nr:glycoside hydrolase family 16 protein [Actinoplanes ovalisporus]MBM2620885.1 glycoside hydrolase family 16 protein [Actinoplanes ovalisporus]